MIIFFLWIYQKTYFFHAVPPSVFKRIIHGLFSNLYFNNWFHNAAYKTLIIVKPSSILWATTSSVFPCIDICVLSHLIGCFRKQEESYFLYWWVSGMLLLPIHKLSSEILCNNNHNNRKKNEYTLKLSDNSAKLSMVQKELNW